jgi:hypothetical protein
MSSRKLQPETQGYYHTKNSQEKKRKYQGTDSIKGEQHTWTMNQVSHVISLGTLQHQSRKKKIITEKDKKNQIIMLM